MLGIHYFLIESRADAREHFTNVAGEDADPLLDSMLLDPEAKSRNDVVDLAKLVFLARIREYDPFSSAENALKVFGSDEISVDVFDRWWTIRDVEYEFSFDAMVKAFLAPVAAKVRTHGNAHLAEIVEHRLGKGVL
jgi:hypothetical protein